MVNVKAASAAGKKYETDLMKYMREKGYDVERLRLTGAEDEGDLLLRGATYENLYGYRAVIEAKRRRGMDLAGWIREAQEERDHYDAHRGIQDPSSFVVVHYARGKGLGGSYVTTTLDEWMRRL